MIASRRALGAWVLALSIGAIVHAAMRSRRPARPPDGILGAVASARFGGPSDGGIPERVRAATESSDPQVVGNAIRTLGRHHRLADSPLARRFIDDARPRVRRETIIGLGLDGSPGAVPLLERALGDPEKEHRALALQALGRIGNEEAKAAIRKMLSRPELSALERTLGRDALDGE